MTSRYRLFAGALLATAMAMPAYAQTQTLPVQMPAQSAPTQTRPAPMMQQQTLQPQQNMQPRQGVAPSNAEIAADAVSDPETDADDVTIEDSAILPSAEGHEASRAPSMALDCEKNPQDCVEPLTRPTTGPGLSTTTQTQPAPSTQQQTTQQPMQQQTTPQPQPQPMQQQTTTQQTSPQQPMQQQPMQQQNLQQQGAAPTNAELAADAVTEPETDADDVTIEDSAILPSAEGHEASRAPSMELDCEKNPEDCVEELTRSTTGPALSTPPR
jgi:hypothetical protein